VISTNTLVKIRRTVVFSFLANRLATATLAQLTAGPRNKGHVTTKIRASEVPFTPTPPAPHALHFFDSTRNNIFGTRVLKAPFDQVKITDHNDPAETRKSDFVAVERDITLKKIEDKDLVAKFAA